MSVFDTDEDPSFMERYRGIVVVLVLLILGGGIFMVVKMLSGTHSSSARQEDISISLPPPPPPPPPRQTPTPPPQQPTPEPQQQQDQKMVEQQPVQDEKKDQAPKLKAPDAPAPLGTSITGPGGGQDLGLGSGLGGGGGYGNGGGGGGTKYGWYASEVQNSIADALRNNPRTRRASMSLVVRVWPDSTGRIIKVHISGSTGDGALDTALQNDILTGIQLNDPPPADMPLPIVMRINAQRPQ
jgi:protein TonB